MRNIFAFIILSVSVFTICEGAMDNVVQYGEVECAEYAATTMLREVGKKTRLDYISGYLQLKGSIEKLNASYQDRPQVVKSVIEGYTQEDQAHIAELLERVDLPGTMPTLGRMDPFCLGRFLKISAALCSSKEGLDIVEIAPGKEERMQSLLLEKISDDFIAQRHVRVEGSRVIWDPI